MSISSIAFFTNAEDHMNDMCPEQINLITHTGVLKNIWYWFIMLIKVSENYQNRNVWDKTLRKSWRSFPIFEIRPQLPLLSSDPLFAISNFEFLHLVATTCKKLYYLAELQIKSVKYTIRCFIMYTQPGLSFVIVRLFSSLLINFIKLITVWFCLLSLTIVFNSFGIY